MAYDMRNYIEELKNVGELFEVNEEVDWRLEAAAYATMSARVEGPALLFNKLKGYPEGYRLAYGLYAGSWIKPYMRLAIMLGLDPKTISEADFQMECGKRFMSPLKPVEVATGTCKEVIKMGKDANLFDFPWPYICEGDGGRYSLMSCIICKDPDSDWVNWSNYRTMIHSRNRLATHPLPGAQMPLIFEPKYVARGQSMPVCIAIGGDPVIFMCAGANFPERVSEVDIAGGLRGAPIELVKAETSDLLVPADAEIVIEGEMRPGEYLPEGPMVESFQFQSGPRAPAYAIRVNCITHRKDPILTTLVQPPASDVQSFAAALMAWAAIMPVNFPPFNYPIKLVGNFIHACNHWFSASTKKYYEGFLTDVANAIFSTTTMVHFDNVFFVDDDVDPTDAEQVMEEIFAKTNPAKDIYRTDNCAPKNIVTCNYLEPWDIDRHVVGMGCITTKKWVDCLTKGKPEIRRTSFETLFSEDVQKWVVDNWQRLGFKEEAKWLLPYIKMKLPERL